MGSQMEGGDQQVVRKGLPDKVTFEQRPRGIEGVAWWICPGNSTPDRGNSKFKGPEAGGKRMGTEQVGGCADRLSHSTAHITEWVHHCRSASERCLGAPCTRAIVLRRCGSYFHTFGVSNQQVFWSPWKSHPRHLLKMVTSRQKAPEPWPQPLAHGLSARHVRQILGRVSSPWLPWDKMPTASWAHSLGCIISDVWGQRAPISSLLLPRWLGDTGRRRGQQLGWLSWSTPLSLLSRRKPQLAGGVSASIPSSETHHLPEAENSLRRPKV